MSFTPVTPPPRFRLSDAVYAQLEKMVVEGTLRPGDTLPSERDLAAQLAVSRPSLREALLRLESRQLIVGRNGGGYQVGNASTALFVEPLAHLMTGHAQTARDVLEMREVLESMAVELAALRATPEDLRKLEAAASRLESAFSGEFKSAEDCPGARGSRGGRAARATQGNGLDELVELDARFHLTMAEATHNVALANTMQAMHGLVRASVKRSYEALGSKTSAVANLVGQHRAIVDAIATGDPEQARRAMRAHLTLVRHGVLATRSD